MTPNPTRPNGGIAPAARPPEPGVTVGGRYELVSRIATGGVGQVWLAHDTVLDRPVAVKVLRNDVTHEPRAAARFNAEARSAAQLTHPGVAVVHDFGEHVAPDGTWPYLVMELVPGESLRARLLAGPLATATTLDVVEQCAAALAAAHAIGLVHRDIKPANILVRADGIVKVTDFGLAVSSDAEPLTATGMILGTAAYISPEQAAGQSATGASDVYALGLVAYECLSGRRGFDGQNIVELLAARTASDLPRLPEDVPRDVAELVADMTRRDPGARPSASEVSTRAHAMRAPTTNAHAVDETVAVTRTAVMPALTTEDAVGTAEPAEPATGSPLGTSILSTRWTRAPMLDGGRRRRLVGLALVLCLVLAGAAALAATRGGGGGGGSSSVSVPAVTGVSVTTAESRLREAGLVPVRRSVDVADTKTGRVTGQSPGPSSAVAPGADVTLDVSTGMVKVPAAGYHDRTYAKAAGALTALGLVPLRRDVVASGTPGYVIGSTPTGRVKVGTTVTVSVVAAPVAPQPGKAKGHGKDDGKGKTGSD